MTAPSPTTPASASTDCQSLNSGDHSRQSVAPKNVAFELVFHQSPQYRARLPMRVQIYPHDTTDSIVTTVKNFYGLYSGPTGSKGVSFEDEEGNTLIARYENFCNNMVVYVRVIEEPPTNPAASFGAHSYATYMPADTFDLQASLQTQQRLDLDSSRPNSRTSRKRSLSPNGCSRRSASASTSGHKARSRSGRSQASAVPHPEACSDCMNGYSSGDNAPDSATSGKAKEQLGNTEISVENIVEGGRRKRAKFESSVSVPFNLLI